MVGILDLAFHAQIAFEKVSVGQKVVKEFETGVESAHLELCHCVLGECSTYLS
jgi:hypothetical protein